MMRLFFILTLNVYIIFYQARNGITFGVTIVDFEPGINKISKSTLVFAGTIASKPTSMVPGLGAS